MGSEWSRVPLQNAMEAIIDYRGKTPRKTSSGVPLITAKIIKDGRILPIQEYIAEADYESWMRRGLPQENDVLLTTEAPLGEVAQLKDDKVALAQRLITLRARADLLDSKFLKFLLQSTDVQHQLKSRASGTTVLGIKQSELRQISLKLPPLPEQKAIAHILGSLDDKIELNRQMNTTLENMAQALFKSWFVDFDPVIDNALVAGHKIPPEMQKRAETRKQALKDGSANRHIAKDFPDSFYYSEELGWIPEGWEGCHLDKMVTVKYGKDHKKLNEGTIPVFGSGGLMRHADAFLYDGESVLIPRKGSLNNIKYVSGKFWTVDTMFYSIPFEQNIAKFVYYFLKRLDFVSMNVGSAVPSMTTKVLNSLCLPNPGNKLLNKFDTLIASYFSKVEANRSTNESLTQLRDTLLPKLISGELRIPQAEKLVEAALT